MKSIASILRNSPRCSQRFLLALFALLFLPRLAFGAQEIEGFTTDRFDLGWYDYKSGANANVAFWGPNIPAGQNIFAFCHTLRGDWNNGPGARMIVGKAVSGTAFRHPVRFDLIWTDAGSGAAMDGGCFRPIPPPGYVSLGDVFVNLKVTSWPDVRSVVCVRQDLAVEGEVKRRVWTSAGSGANTFFQAWTVGPKEKAVDAVDLGGFRGFTSASPNASAWCLKASAFVNSAAPSDAYLAQLITKFGPDIRFHPSEPWLPDDPAFLLDHPDTLLKWMMTTNETSMDYPTSKFTQTAIGSMTTSSSTLLDDVQVPLSDPQAGHADFHTVLSYNPALVGGSLSRAKAWVRVQPHAGAFTELQFWIFSPNNGPGKAIVQALALVGFFPIPVNFTIDPTGTVGRHLSDWEMVRVRVSKKNVWNPGVDELLSVGMSVHDHEDFIGGYDPALGKTAAGNPIVYAGLGSHAHHAVAQEVNIYANLVSINLAQETSGYIPGYVSVDTYDRTATGGQILQTWNNKSTIVSSAWPSTTTTTPSWLFYNGQFGDYQLNSVGLAIPIPYYGVINKGITEVGNGKPGLIRTRWEWGVPCPQNANLGSLRTTVGSLSPAFSQGVTTYSVSLPAGVRTLALTPQAVDSTALVQVRVNGGAYVTQYSGERLLGKRGDPLVLSPGANAVEIKVTVPPTPVPGCPSTVKTYTLNVAATAPRLAVEQPTGTALPGGSVVGFGTVAVGSTGVPKTFTIKNTGTSALTLSSVGKAGGNSGDFIVNTTGMLTSIPAGGQTSFTVAFQPAAAGARATTLRVLSNDAVAGTFDLPLTGTGVAPTPEITIDLPPGTLPLGGVVAWGGNFSGQSTVPPAAQSGVSAISAGLEHTLALKADGLVVAWGSNGYGQSTVPVAAQSGVSAIAAGDYHSVALKNNGSVVAWGSNGQGQTTVPGAAQSGVIAISAGNNHTLALKSDGSVVAWGSNASGQSAVPAAAQSGVAAISAGHYFSVALKSNGSVLAWGYPGSGQTAVPAAASSGVIAIAAGNSDILALKNDGSVIAWGGNFDGGATVPTAALSGVIAIAAGYGHSMALKSDGTVIAWGRNDNAQATVPTGLGQMIDISAGNKHSVALVRTPAFTFGSQPTGTASAAKTFTIRNTGSGPLSLTGVSTTGGNSGDFAVNTTGTLTSIPVGGQTTFSVTFTPAVSGLRSTTLRVLSNDADEATTNIAISGTGVGVLTPEIAIELPPGTSTLGGVFAWGWNQSGQLNVPVEAQSGVTAIAGGSDHTVALKNGVVLSWGTTFSDLQTVPAEAQSGVSEISAGNYHTLALKSGKVLAWGYNADGQITVPAEALSGVTRIEAGYNHSVALTSNGKVLNWGNNVYGQLNVPTAALSGVSAISAGDGHTVALKNGAVLTWGLGNSGLQTVPAEAQSGVSMIAAGGYHTLALKDGKVIAWGDNDYSQSTVPEAAQSGVVAIAGGFLHSVALKSDGTVVTWGYPGLSLQTVPAQAQSGVIAIAAGLYHTVVVVGTSGASFGSRLLGTTSASQTFTIRNTGSGPLTITGVSTTGGNSGDFAVNTTGMLTSVPAGGQTAFSVAFTPAAAGLRATTLQILSNDADEPTSSIPLSGAGIGLPEIVIEHPAGTPVGPTAIAFGNQNTGSNSVAKTFTIKNTGTALLSINGVSTVDGFNTEFAVNLTGMLTVLPTGAQTTFTVTFNPAGLGLRTTTLRILSNDSDEATTNVLLNGTGTSLGAPEIVIEQPAGTTVGATVAFGNQNISTPSSVKTFTIKNTGTVELGILGLGVTGGNTGDFTVNLTGMLSSIPAGGQTTFTVTFKPAALGSRTTTLRVLNSDANEGTTDIQLTGTGVDPQQIFIEQPTGIPAPATVAYGNQNLGSASAAKTFTIRNTSSTAITPSFVVTTGGNSGDFTVNTTGMLASIPAGGQTNFTVAFQPTAPGARATTVRLFWNNAALTVYDLIDIALTGTGINVSSPEIQLESPAGTPLAGGTVTAWGKNTQGQTTVPAGLNAVSAVSGGFYHSVALKTDGTVVAWGDNDYNQLSVPGGLSRVISISAGGYHTMALKTDGTLVGWGNNGFGQTTIPAGLGGVTAIAAGYGHTLVLKSDGTVAAWGLNDFGQTNVPAGLNGVVALAGSYISSMALKSDGTVVKWGNDWGATPGGLNGVIAIAAGSYHYVALKGDGTVVAWGNNASGQASVPAGLSGVIAIGAGDTYSVALKNDGTVVSWGANDQGQTSIPTGLGGVSGIAAGYYHALALGGTPTVSFGNQTVATTSAAKTVTIRNTGAGPLSITGVSAAGGNSADFTVNTAGMLSSVPAGGQTTFTVAFKPSASGSRTGFLYVLSNDLDEATSIITLAGTGTAVLGPEIAVELPLGAPAVGNLVAWGYNSNGQTTVPVAAQSGVNGIAAGYVHTVALKPDGTVIAWGQNASGQTNVPAGLNGVTAIAAGYWHSVALKSDGTVRTWGSGTENTVPAGLTGVSAIAGGNGGFTMALKTDGSVVAWGANGAGQSTVPPEALGGVIAIAAGSHHAVALREDAGVVAWGENSAGQTTVPVGALSGVIAIAAGGNHTVALKSDGSVLAWGSNDNGQTTVPAAAQSGVIAIAAGDWNTLALKSDGSVVSWGYGGFGINTVPAGAQSGVVAISGALHALALVATPTVDFSNRLTGTTTATKTFTIKNSGTDPLSLTSVSTTGGNSGDFIVSTSAMLTSVPAAGQTTFTVAFSPTVSGTRTTTLRVLNNDANEGTTNITLTGRGLTALENWRQIYFASPDNTGNGADLSDTERDGIGNLFEFAFGLNPTLNSAGQLPRPQKVGGNLVTSFIQPDDVSGVTYGAEWSTTLQAGSWTAIPDTGSGTTHTFSISIGTVPKLFMRLKVTNPNP